MLNLSGSHGDEPNQQTRFRSIRPGKRPTDSDQCSTSKKVRACDISGNLGQTLGVEKEKHLNDGDTNRPIRDRTGKNI
jgi:hypothetical protein